MADERRYVAFLVRLWSVHHNGELIWRASAENVHTGERHAFADLSRLCRLLVEVTSPAAAQDETGAMGVRYTAANRSTAYQ